MTSLSPVSGHTTSTAVGCEFALDGVLRVHLSNGRRRNVLGRSTLDALDAIASHPPEGTRVLLVSADGPDFCAGYDLAEAAREGPEHLLALPGAFSSLRGGTLPVVAALEGNVIGGGLELALCADVLIATRNTAMSIPASRLGLVYSLDGVRQLVDAVGASTARTMLVGGRVLRARDARMLGVVAEVVAHRMLDARALEVAAHIAAFPPAATAGNRLMFGVALGYRDEDPEALRLSSFAPGGALAANIERFLSPARRAMGHQALRSFRRATAARVPDAVHEVTERVTKLASLARSH